MQTGNILAHLTDFTITGNIIFSMDVCKWLKRSTIISLGKNMVLSILERRFMPTKFPSNSKSAPPCIT
jgi:hypothetical protein